MPRKRQSKQSRNLPLFPKKPLPQPPEGYYSGDQPNPNLRAFVEQHLLEHPYDPATDDYDVPAFNKPIRASKTTAIYNMHTYWSKKPHDAIRQYIRHYTHPGDLVLDPFCGSGSTALAALLEGRKAIAVDRSPAATFITKNYCTPLDIQALENAFDEFRARAEPEIAQLYETRCDRCGGRAVTGYTVYSQVYECPRCTQKVPLYDCVEVTVDSPRGLKAVRACPHCHSRGVVEPISTRKQKYGAVPVRVTYTCADGCKPGRGSRLHNDPDPKKRDYFERYDLSRIREIEREQISDWYPNAELSQMIPYRMLHKKDFRPSDAHQLTDLYTRRNLRALAKARAALASICAPTSTAPASAIWVAMDTVALTGSRMLRETKRAIQTGTYYIPPLSREINVWTGLEYNYVQAMNALAALDRVADGPWQVCISTQSACNLNSVLSGSVDFIFTDPPYAEKVQYGELNYLWEAWLGLETNWRVDEIIVNEVVGKSEARWAQMMKEAMAECYRVLKPGRWLSLCYHDTSAGTWSLVQDIMTEVGFVADRSGEALYIDSGGSTYNQLTADKVNKRDLVINFRKPASGRTSAASLTSNEDERTFREQALRVIREYLSVHPGETKDHIYDDLVSRLVRAGRMEPHNFDELLALLAEPVREPVRKNLFENEEPNLFGTHEVVRWFLKEGDEVAPDATEAAKEDAAAEALGAYIRSELQSRPGLDGVEYGRLFEQYVYKVQDRPRRDLPDWLPDYFFVTESGGYRLPADEEEEQLKAQARASGTNRRIKRYLAALAEGRPIPPAQQPGDATLVDWIRQCKRGGLYEQGKMLYERGGLRLERLPEEVQVQVEEDYQTCVRLLARGK